MASPRRTAHAWRSAPNSSTGRFRKMLLQKRFAGRFGTANSVAERLKMKGSSEEDELPSIRMIVNSADFLCRKSGIAFGMCHNNMSPSACLGNPHEIRIAADCNTVTDSFEHRQI